jgi:hypothetical protein
MFMFNPPPTKKKVGERPLSVRRTARKLSCEDSTVVTSATQPARPIVEAYLGRLELPGTTVRTLAAGHWGLTLEAAGWPLHIGVAVRQGVLEALSTACSARS